MLSIIIFIYFITKLASTYSFGKPYLLPYAPTSLTGLKDSIIQLPLRVIKKERVIYLIILLNNLKSRRKLTLTFVLRRQMKSI